MSSASGFSNQNLIITQIVGNLLPIVTLIVFCINAIVSTNHSRVPAVFIDPGKQGRGPGQVENRDNILPGLGEMSQCDVE